MTTTPRFAILHGERRYDMPVIARFYGILIKMYFRERGVPHFHAVYAEFNGVFDVTTLEMIEGDLPPRAQRLVRDWAEQYKDELQRMWETQNYKKLPGLE
jgi:hypothetical protein